MSNSKLKLAEKILAHAGSGIVVIQLGKLALGFLLSLLLARTLGARELGIYAFVMSAASILAVAFNRGFAELILRECSTLNVTGNLGKVRGLLIRANRISLIFLCITAASIALLALTNETLFDPYPLPMLLVATAIAFFLSANNNRQSGLRAFGRAEIALLPEYIVRPIALGTLVLLGYLLLGQLSAGQALATNLVVTISIFLFGSFLFRQRAPEELLHAKPTFNNAEWWDSCKHFLFIGGMLIINTHADRLMLGTMGHIDMVGVYAVAIQIASLAGLALIALNLLIAPRVARLYQEKKKEKIAGLLARPAVFTLIGSTLIAMVLVVYGKPILGIFGEEFGSGFYAVCILVLGQWINVSFGPTGTLLKMMGHERALSLIVAFSAAANILCNFFLIPSLGIDGAAISTAIALLLWNALSLWYLAKHEGVVSAPWFNFMRKTTQ